MNSLERQSQYSPKVSAFLQKPARFLIGAEWVTPAAERRIAVEDPSSGRVVAEIGNGSEVDADLAVRAAHDAFVDRRWRGLAPAHREAIVRKLADLIETHADEFAEIEAIDSGKTRTSATYVDIPAAISSLRHSAGWIGKLPGEHIAPWGTGGDIFHGYVRREPVGVVAAITPWNFPLMIAVFKLAPALAAGCTIVLKPAEQTSLSALRLGELVQEAGFPAGVVNIVTGSGPVTGDALVRHPLVNKIAFTGSTAVGKAITRAGADTLKRVTLELGGKSPVIVMPDVDIEEAAMGASQAAFFNAGQVCVAGSRLYAHRSVYDDLLGRLAEGAVKMKLGPSLAQDTDMGPLISKAQRERVMSYIDGARKAGASIEAGGDALGDGGFFVQPTVIANVSSDLPAMREEIFGPVLCVSRFDEVDEMILRANDTTFGLAASVWTQEVAAMHGIAARINAGFIWGNCHGLIDPNYPFGGFGQSGVGREGGVEGILAYTEAKSIMIRL
jgi:phenylacetaldehyde dehydrogenase